LSLLRAEKIHVAVLAQGIAAEQKMITDAPTIARARDCRHRSVNLRNFVRLVSGAFG